MHQENKIVKAVIGILKNTDGEILIAERRPDQFMGGYWELPGGKIEPSESNEEALARELKEELGVVVFEPSLLHTMCHHYEEKTVYLWIYNVDVFDGEANGAEGQNIAWSPASEFGAFRILPTMKAIIHKICLPDHYWITPENKPEKTLLEQLQVHITNGTRMVQLRAKKELRPLFIDQFYQVCHDADVKLILNTPNKTYKESCDGWHLTTNELLSLSERPCDSDKLLGASTHDLIEVKHAEIFDADYISIAPVESTKSHPGCTPLGWKKAEALVSKSNLPAYLLGGMNKKNLERALSITAQGVAGISQL